MDELEKKQQVNMIKSLAKVTGSMKGLQNISGAIISATIYLGCNCAGLTSDEISPLVNAIEESFVKLLEEEMTRITEC